MRRRDGRMHCLRAALLLQRHLDGHLDEGLAARVAAHLAECARCGLEAETYRAIRDSLARAEPPPRQALSRLTDFARGLGDGGPPAPGGETA